MPRMPVAGGELHYEVHGEGPPLLLVAGLGGVGSFWDPQLDALASRFQVITHDHRGTGRSSRDLITYSVPQMAADVLALADGLGLARFHYMGHSTGAAIGQEIALRHPGRVETAVLSSGWTRRDPWFARCFDTRLRLLDAGGPEAYIRGQALFTLPAWWVGPHAEQLRRMEAAQLAAFPPVAIVKSRIAAILDYGLGDELAGIAAPTLVVCADDDALTPPHYSAEMHELIPGSDLAILPTGGHFNPTTRAHDFNVTVAGWLASHLDGTAWTAPDFVGHDTVHRARP